MAISYNTLGNEVKYRITQDMLTTYLENATISFPLPEASSEILAELVTDEHVDPEELGVVQSKLEHIGFAPRKANIMASVILAVAKQQGTDPLVYFNDKDQALKLANDTYQIINALRPVGNQIGVTTPIQNSKSRYRKLIQP